MLISGFEEEEGEEPIERTEKQSFLGFGILREPKTTTWDLEPKSRWVLAEMYGVVVCSKLKLREAISEILLEQEIFL